MPHDPSRPDRPKIWARLCRVLLALALMATTSPSALAAAAPAQPPKPESKADEVPNKIGAGWKLRITVPDEPSQTITAIVDIDGTIDLEVYGKMHIAGYHPDDAVPALHAHLRDYLRNTRGARLDVLERGAMVLILGMVQTPGLTRVEWEPELWQAIQRAGGLIAGADTSRVRLARDGREQLIDMRSMLAEDPQNLPRVRSGDVIHVAAERTLSIGGGQADGGAFLGRGSMRSKMFVLGTVAQPGLYDLSDEMTAPMALALAGGPSGPANLENVFIVTPDGNQTVNLAAQLRGTEPSYHLPDVGGVIVYVPERGVTVESAFSKYINVIGGVGGPGRIEVAGPMLLVDVLSMAGGPDMSARRHKVYHMSVSDTGTITRKYMLRRFLRRGGMLARVMVQPGDTLFIGARSRSGFDTVMQFISSLAVLSSATLTAVTLADRFEQDASNAN